jgi:DNA-binding IclR family transcriptional regulator
VVNQQLTHAEVSSDDAGIGSGADRVLAILTILGSYPDGIGLNDLARLTNSPRSSVHRALAVLRRADLIEQDGNSRYRLGYGLLKLAFSYYEELDVVSRIRPVLADLAAAYGETAHYAILDGIEVVYLAKVQSNSGRFQMKSAIGGRNPAYCTGVGKAILAYSLTSLAKVEAFIAQHPQPLHRYNKRTLTSAQQLFDEFTLIRQRGYAMDREEHEEGLHCLALPLFLTSSAIPDGAISVTAMTQRISPATLEASVGRAQDLISQHLGAVLA